MVDLNKNDVTPIKINHNINNGKKKIVKNIISLALIQIRSPTRPFRQWPKVPSWKKKIHACISQ